MASRKESVYQLVVPKDSIIQFRKERPDDYHCTCEYCQNFMGEMYDIEAGKYYSNLARKKYLPKAEKMGLKHNNPGHFVGYRWAIQNLTKPGDLVFDPTVGTGTAIFEAENNGRRGVGVELEFPETTKYLCEGRGKIIEGNTLEVEPSDFLEKESISLLVNGTPYPVISGGSSSDAYFASATGQKTYYGDYKNKNNIGKWKVKEFAHRIHEMYTKYVPYIKSGGRLAIIIKDPTHQKKPFNLHKMIADSILENNECLEYEGYFLHKHIPTTLFMVTYPKRYGIVPPLYQTGVVLKKK